MILGALAQASQVPSKVVVDHMSARETSSQSRRSAPWRCQRHPSLPAGPPQDHQLPGSDPAPRPSAARRTLQREATSRDSSQVACPFPQGQRDKLLQEQPSGRPLPRMPSATTWNSEAPSLWIFGRGERERNRKTHSNRRSEVASKGQES